ncbi:MAG: glycoside hydrolase family 18 protein [Chitinispirillales bacterium]|jgi:hypothetical protein|nr:glycoside hydrolase family 18 protein [Chitinispirillales bacterium]
MKKFLFVLAVLILPTALFAKGAVKGYFQSWRGQPTATQYDNLTHAILFQLFPDPGKNDGSLTTEFVYVNVNTFVSNAHAKGVKAIVGVGGWDQGDPHYGKFTNAFVSVCSDATKRAKFVNEIKNYINNNSLDGVDIDWEYPSGSNWNNYIQLLKDLRAALPGKEISTALPGESPNGYYPSIVRTDIWQAVDAIHLMTYDMWDWPTHSDAGKSKELIDAWANWGSGQSGFSKEKLVIGCAFYGSPGDNTASVKTKVDHCYDNGYGGVMIWEILCGISNTSENNQLLEAAWAANKAKGGYKGGEPVIITRKITVTYSQSGGTVKNQGTGATVYSGTPVDVENGKSLTLSFIPNNGYSITDVKINGNSNEQAKNAKTYTFNDVTQDASINVIFNKDGVTPTDAPDLADGSWEWEESIDNENRGSSVTFNVAEGNISFSLNIGTSDEEKDIWSWAEIASYVEGDWTGVTGITINYTSNKNIHLVLQDNIGLTEDGRGYYYELVAGTNVNKTIPITDFKHIEDDWETLTPLSVSQLSIFEGVSITPVGEMVMTTGSIKLLKINGLIVEEDDPGPGIPIVRNKAKNVSTAGVSVVNGNINLSLSANANNAHIVLFDLRGRILFERNVAVNGNFASVALPQSISRNQVMMLQVKTNSGVNMTKRILIK